MVILQIITLSELGGAQKVLINLSNQLSKGNDVVVAAGEGDGKVYEELVAKVKKESIPSLKRNISPINDIKTIFKLRKLYKKYKPDIIHLHSSKAGLLGRLVFPKKKIVYTVHGFDSIRLAHRKFLFLEKLLQYRCSSIIGVSQYDTENLNKEGISKNVECIYNGVQCHAKLKGNPFASIKGFKNKVLTIARLAPPKNHKLFLEIASKLQDVAFFWIGNQNDPDFEYPNNVFFIGNISNAASYIEYSDLFLLPSDFEGLPMVIIEASESHKPSIASKVGGMLELIDKDNGYVIENNSDLMAEKIQEFFNLSEDKRKEMGERAYKKYLSNFTIEKMTERYLETYNKILERNKK